jgi:hypothetical protein
MASTAKKVGKSNANYERTGVGKWAARVCRCRQPRGRSRRRICIHATGSQKIPVTIYRTIDQAIDPSVSA